MMVITEYGCDTCLKRVSYQDIVWITSSYGICEACREGLSENEVEELAHRYE